MRRALVALTALAMVSPVLAQAPTAMPSSYRDVQLRMLQLQRRSALAMADSMPETLYAHRVTPIQRTFAEQITHAAGAAPRILAQWHPDVAAALPDTAVAHRSRDALRGFINAAYDAAEAMLASETAEQRAGEINLFGNRMPLWQVWNEMHQHAFWTLGQLVANFRLNGMAPPGFGFF